MARKRTKGKKAATKVARKTPKAKKKVAKRGRTKANRQVLCSFC